MTGRDLDPLPPVAATFRDGQNSGTKLGQKFFLSFFILLLFFFFFEDTKIRRRRRRGVVVVLILSRWYSFFSFVLIVLNNLFRG